MKIEILRDVLVELGEVERLIGRCHSLDLWRAIDASEAKDLFRLVENDIVRAPGKISQADITIRDYRGEKWVYCRDFPRGVSTFDRAGVFRGDKWKYYKIPAGTMLPEGIVIVRDFYNLRYGATHHTIAPERDMALRQFRALLAEFATHIIGNVA